MWYTVGPCISPPTGTSSRVIKIGPGPAPRPQWGGPLLHGAAHDASVGKPARMANVIDRGCVCFWLPRTAKPRWVPRRQRLPGVQPARGCGSQPPCSGQSRGRMPCHSQDLARHGRSSLLLGLDREVTAMRLVELLLGDSDESVVNVHVRWHQMLLRVAVGGVDHYRTRHLGGRFHYWREGAVGP